MGDRLSAGKPSQYFSEPPGPTQPATLSGTGNTHVWQVKLCGPLLTRAVLVLHGIVVFSGWLGSLVVRVLDSQLDGCEFNLQPQQCRVTTLGKLFTPMCLCR